MELRQEDGLFVAVRCPVCDADNCNQLSPSLYPPGVTSEQMSAMYSASSESRLMDATVQCRECSMVYVNPQPATEVFLSGYEQTVDPTFVAQNPERIRAFGRTLRSVLGKAGLKSRGKLLDVGCAGAAFVVAAREVGFEAQGVEPCHWLADFGRQTYGVEVRQGLLLPGSYTPESFDVVSMWDVLEHVPRPKDVVETVRAVLKPGGYFIVSYPDIGTVTARLLGRKWPFWLSVHLHYYTRQTMRRQLTQAGFDVLVQQPMYPALKLGYVFQRAGSHFGVFRWIGSAVNALGLDSVPVYYNIGQTVMLARKPPR